MPSGLARLLPRGWQGGWGMLRLAWCVLCVERTEDDVLIVVRRHSLSER